MRIYLVGIACVGKSTIGEAIAEKLGYKFIDFDFEVEKRIGDRITTIKNRHFTDQGYRNEVKHILKEIFQEYKENLVLAMPPSGMYREYLTTLKKNPDVLTITLKDSAKNILERLTFYDDESQLIEEEVVNDRNRDIYYRDVKDDIEYYYATHKKTKMKFHMNGMNIEQSVEALLLQIKQYFENEEIENN